MPSRLIVGLSAVAMTLGVSLWVSGRTAPTAVALSALDGPSYAQDVSGFRPVTRRLITEVNREPTPVRTKGTLPSRTTGGLVAEPGPASTEPVPLPHPAPPAPALSIQMTASDDKAHPNQTIVYSLRVTNAGPGAARGVVIESHVPDGTTLRGWTCDDENFKAEGAESLTCGNLASAAATTHPVVFVIPVLAEGESAVREFWVRVGHGAMHNAAIVNHAHVYARDADLADSDEVSVIVR